MLNPITRQNLITAIKQLPIKAEEFPHIRTDFNMAWFGCMFARKLVSDCGTAGCLLGNLVHVFPPVESDFDLTFCYNLFERRILPELNPSQWGFLFSEKWAQYDNTFDAAITRMRFLLACNGFVKNFCFDGEIAHRYMKAMKEKPFTDYVIED